MAEGNFLRIERTRGRPVVVGERQITPVALTVRVGVSWRDRIGAGLAWARPLAVEVYEDGETRRLPIPDYTLRANLALGVLGLLVPIFGALVERRRR